jgi:hypothetical protein
MLTCTTLPNNRQRAHAAKGYRDREKLRDGTSAESDAHLNFPRDFSTFQTCAANVRKKARQTEREESQEKDEKEEIEGCGEVIFKEVRRRFACENCLVSAPSAAQGKGIRDKLSFQKRRRSTLLPTAFKILSL